MRVLSLFDGMGCGHIALTEMGVPIEKYDAYEIDKYAIQTATHNFPDIVEKGNVFDEDFSQYEGQYDILMSGFPCTKFSIAQKNNRETQPYSGEGWDMFMQTYKAIREVRPKCFLLENNKSMSKDVQNEINRLLGFEPMLINSALVSAQNRQRFYWCGIRQDDGTYRKADIKQPEDRGILLKDILENGLCVRDKSHTIDACYYKGGNVTSLKKQSGERMMAYECVGIPQTDDGMKYAASGVAEPINITDDGKSQTIKAQYQKTSVANIVKYKSTYGTSGVAEPCRIPPYSADDKSRPVEALYPNHSGTGEGSLEQRLCSDNPNKQQVDLVAYSIRVGTMPSPDGTLEGGQSMRVYSPEGKAVTINTGKTKTGSYAVTIPECFRVKEATPIYEVKDGMITVKGKQYPIKLVDGYYIIRKLTVKECMRLQTVPEWYEFVVSDTQAYKMLGNGWTVEVIKHLLKGMIADDERRVY